MSRPSLAAALLAAGLAALLATGCASIVSKSQYPVTFDTEPTGGEVVIRDERTGELVHKGVAPMTVVLDAGAGYFKPARYDVDAAMPGRRSTGTVLVAENDPWYLGNALFGGLIGLLAVDPLSGAMWKLDDRVVVELGPELGPATPRDIKSDVAYLQRRTERREIDIETLREDVDRRRTTKGVEPTTDAEWASIVAAYRAAKLASP